jgi:very-short-patch-repair endonuclease
MPRTSPQSEETKKKISLTMKKRRSENDWWKGRDHRSEVRDKISRTFMNKWNDKEFSHAMALSQARRPTKPEKEFDKFLQDNFPNEWMYTGDGRVKVAGVNPDFVNIQGKNLIIELFGEYFHHKNDEAKRTKLFNSAGFRCLVVWVKELSNPDKLKIKVRSFLNGETIIG